MKTGLCTALRGTYYRDGLRKKIGRIEGGEVEEERREKDGEREGRKGIVMDTLPFNSA